MGNVQCVPGTYDMDSDDSSKQSKPLMSPSLGCLVESFPNRTTSNKNNAPRSSSSFLQVHLDDRPQKCILDSSEVTKLLVDQAEELLRRELQTQQQGDAQPVDEVEEETARLGRLRAGDSTWTGAGLFSLAASELAQPTVTTSHTTGTRRVSNLDKYDPYGGVSKKRRHRPKMKGSSDVLQSLEFHDEVRKILPIDEEGNLVNEATTPFAFVKQVGCLLPDSVVSDNPDATTTSEKALEYLQALHLTMRPQNADCYRRHILHLKLNGLDLKESTEGIPAIATTKSSIVRSEKEIDIEFGQGPASLPVRVLVTDTAFMDLAVTGSLGLVDRRRKASSHLVLINRRSGIPLAVCALKMASTGPPVVRIYATKHRVYGQKPAVTTTKIGLNWSTKSLPLYSWAKIVAEGRYSERLRYSIYMASGSEGRFEEEPSYRAGHDSSSIPTIRMVGRTEREDAHEGCALITLGQDEDEDPIFRVSVSRGIDPALLICFTAFLDEVMEKTMRMQDC